VGEQPDARKMPSHNHQFVELVKALSEKTGQPSIRNPPHEIRREIDADGLDDRDFESLLDAVVNSRHRNLPGRSVRLLVPRKKLGAKLVRKVVAAFSRTNSNFLRLCLVRYLNACLDARNVLSLSGIDCLRSAYGVFFHYLAQDKCQKEMAKLLYRLTRKVDVTPFRARELSRILTKLGSKASNVMALAEIFDSYTPGLVAFPARENGLPGSSGLSFMSRLRMHAKILRVKEWDWVEVLKRVCVEDDEDEDESRKFFHERAFPTKRPKLFAIPETSVMLSDYFRISALLEEQNPRESLPDDVEAALFAHLLTWDGIEMQDETFEAVSRLKFPAPDQELFERSVLFPLMDLFQTSTSTFKLRMVRSVARMLGSWITSEPRGSSAAALAGKVIRLVDDSLCAALVLDRDEPLIQVAASEFYIILGRFLLKRSTKSLKFHAVPPSRALVHRLLLSPSALGSACLGETMTSLVPVFKLEAVLGGGEAESNRVIDVFQTLARDCVKTIALNCAHEAFEDATRTGTRNDRDVVAETGLDFIGDELGILRSFGFALFWRQWYEDKGLEPEQVPSDEVVAAYLVFLGKFAPGLVALVSSIASKFNKVAAAVRSNERQEDEEDDDEEDEEEEEE
jgi:hypothetical protein